MNGQAGKGVKPPDRHGPKQWRTAPQDSPGQFRQVKRGCIKDHKTGDMLWLARRIPPPDDTAPVVQDERYVWRVQHVK
jgi:hypothetical protein